MPALSKTQLNQFDEEGYLVVEDLLDPEKDLKPVMDEYAETADWLCDKLYSEGKVPSPYRELSFGEKASKLLIEGGLEYYQYFDFSLPQSQVTEDTPIYLGKEVFNMLRNPRLLDAAESLIGPEIYSNPVQHIRLRPAESQVPAGHPKWTVQQTFWHQDLGVVLPEADGTEMLTVWFPVNDTDAENGCLWVIPGSHRDGLATHCPADQKIKANHIPDKLMRMEDARPLPMKAGSVLFMTRYTMHGAYENRSNRIRISFDLRYNPIGQPTGRPWFPGFVARSRKNPESELKDPEVWADLWRQARSSLAQTEKPTFQRWTADNPVCA